MPLIQRHMELNSCFSREIGYTSCGACYATE